MFNDYSAIERPKEGKGAWLKEESGYFQRIAPKRVKFCSRKR